MSKKDGVLFLVVKEPWFSMHKSGEKQEEYREIKEFYANKWIGYYSDYLAKKLVKCIEKNSELTKFHAEDIEDILHSLPFKTLHFTLGMPKKGSFPERHLVFQNPKIRIGTGKPEWGAKPGKLYFVTTWEEM